MKRQLWSCSSGTRLQWSTLPILVHSGFALAGFFCWGHVVADLEPADNCALQGLVKASPTWRRRRSPRVWGLASSGMIKVSPWPRILDSLTIYTLQPSGTMGWKFMHHHPVCELLAPSRAGADHGSIRRSSARALSQSSLLGLCAVIDI